MLASVSMTMLAQNPTTTTGTKHLPHHAEDYSGYGGAIHAADEGGFFVSPSLSTGNYTTWAIGSDTVYFVFPSDSTNLTAASKFSPGIIKIAPPGTALAGSFGSVILEMDDYLLIADTLGNSPAGIGPRIFLYEEIHDAVGNRWEYTGKFVEYDNIYWKLADIEKISATEVAVAIYDTLLICDFNPTATPFLTRKQVILDPGPNVVNYPEFPYNIEVLGNRLIVSSPHGAPTGSSPGANRTGVVHVFERANTSSAYTHQYYMARSVERQDGLGWGLEHTRTLGTDFVLMNHYKSYNNNQLLLAEVGPNGFIAHDSLGINSTSGFSTRGRALMDANQGIFYVMYSQDRTYTSTNASIGVVRVLKVDQTATGYALNWVASILPEAGAANDTTYLGGDVAIGNFLATSNTSQPFGFGWAVGNVLETLTIAGNSVNAGGAWYTSWNANSPTVSVNENVQTITTRAYPNPAVDRMHIEFEESLNAQNVFLLNASGQMVQSHVVSGSSMELERGDLPSGIYFLQVQSGRVLSTTKVVFQ